jgi:hypothetical protein
VCVRGKGTRTPHVMSFPRTSLCLSMYSDVHLHTRAHGCMLTHCMCVYTHVHTQSNPHMYKTTHAYLETYDTCGPGIAHLDMLTCVQKHTCTYHDHTCTQLLTFSCVHRACTTHLHTHTHTHTHTQPHAPSCFLPCCSVR